MEAMLDNVRTGVISVNRRGQVTILNQFASELLNINPNAVIGKPFNEIFKNEYLEPIRSLIRSSGSNDTSNLSKQIEISYKKIGTSTIQSRAIAAIINDTYIFSLPGSPSACKDGWDEILRLQLDIRHKPCNFIEIMPRLTER